MGFFLWTHGPHRPWTSDHNSPSNLLNVDAEAFVSRGEGRKLEAFRTLVEAAQPCRLPRGLPHHRQRSRRRGRGAGHVHPRLHRLKKFEARSGFGTWRPHRRQLRHRRDSAPAAARRGRRDETEPLLARLASPAPGPERVAAGRQLEERIDTVLEGLTPLERAAFTLRHLEQQSIDEISATLGQNPAATRHSIFRAVAKMRRALGPVMRTDP